MRRHFIALSLAMIAWPALADTTAVYDGPGSFKMTIEIAANGDLRADVAAKPGEYFLTRNGEGFVVQPTARGVVVDRLSDISAAMSDVIKEKMPQRRDPMPSLAQRGDFFVEGDVVTVNGRSGTAYYFRGQSATNGRPPVLVISHDPSLAPLGQAMARQNEMSNTLSAGLMGGKVPFADEMDSILKSGAPLAVGPAHLSTVSTDPIPASHFALPSLPEARAEIRARLEATSTDHSVVGF